MKKYIFFGILFILSSCTWEVPRSELSLEKEDIFILPPETKDMKLRLEDSTEELIAALGLDELSEEMLRLYIIESDSFRNQWIHLSVAHRLKELIEESRIDEIKSGDIDTYIHAIQSEGYPFCESPYANPLSLWKYFDVYQYKMDNNYIENGNIWYNIYHHHEQLCAQGIGKFCAIPDPCALGVDEEKRIDL